MKSKILKFPKQPQTSSEQIKLWGLQHTKAKLHKLILEKLA